MNPKRASLEAGSLIAVVLLAAACAGGSTTALQEPPEIRYGEEVCDLCGMIVSDERFAAATVTVDSGEESIRRFDDLGCLFGHTGAGERAPDMVWVHDVATYRWIQAEDAWFTRDPRRVTPMGSGIAAYSERPQTPPGDVEVFRWHQRTRG